MLPDGLELDWHWEPEEPLGTAGALRIMPELDETFLAMNGDIPTTLDYAALMDHHRASGAALTIAVQHVRAYRSDADWFDIGTLAEYERAVAELERRGGWPE